MNLVAPSAIKCHFMVGTAHLLVVVNLLQYLGFFCELVTGARPRIRSSCETDESNGKKYPASKLAFTGPNRLLTSKGAENACLGWRRLS